MLSTMYVAHNNTKTDLLLWFDDRKKLNQSDNIKRYFYKRNGEVSLYEILNDELIKDKRLNIFGQTFIALIKPKGQFQIFVTCNKKNRREDISIEKSIVIIKSTAIDKSLKRILYENRQYFYQSSFIVIPSLNE